MRTLFVTSSPTGDLDGNFRVEGLDWRNGFKDEVLSLCHEGMRALIIAAYPERYEGNDEMCDYFRNALLLSGISLACFDLMDRRYDFSKEDIESYDLIILSGGHTPTENAYFESVGLKEKMRDFDGIVIGISAGSMNMADHVYFQPEEPGESSDDFVTSGTGLGLCNVNVVPHFQMIRYSLLDGYRLVDDLILRSTYDRDLYALCDGAYFRIDDHGVVLKGRSYLLSKGEITMILDEGMEVSL